MKNTWKLQNEKCLEQKLQNKKYLELAKRKILVSYKMKNTWKLQNEKYTAPPIQFLVCQIN
jgi:hypothetical protein